MPQEPFVRVAPVQVPGVPQGEADTPEMARCTISEEVARDVLRTSAFLQTMNGADELTIGNIASVEWFVVPVPTDEISVALKNMRPYQDADAEDAQIDHGLAVQEDGTVWITGTFPEGSVQGYLTTVEDIAAHFDLSVEPPAPATLHDAGDAPRSRPRPR